MIALYRQLFLPYRLTLLIILTGYAITIIISMPTYLDFLSLSTVLGMGAIIFTWDGGAVHPFSRSWLVAAGLLLILYAWVPSKFILYSVIGMGVFSLLETVAGRAGRLALFSLVLMSPLSEYFSNVFGFPIRLELTQLAGHILHVFDAGFHTQGNVLLKGSEEFSVDTACMGLHMLVGSLLSALIVVGIFQRHAQKKLPVRFFISIGLPILILNLLSNIIRIIFLVSFQIAPENKMHAAVGLVCFLLYVLLPSVFLIRFFVGRFGKNFNQVIPHTVWRIHTAVLHVFLWATIFGVALAGKNRSINAYLPTGNVIAPGYQIEKMPDAIVKLSTAKGLVYLKPVIGFYSSDHQPTMCWKGSGYEFKKIVPLNLDGQTIYTSCLEKETAILYTAWWYDNSHQQTISQFEWRWESFKNNSPWVLVNVTASSQAELISQIRQLRKLNPCRMLLNPN